MTENKIMLSCEMNDGKPDHCKTNRMICRQYSQFVIIVVLYPKHTLLVGKESVLCHTNVYMYHKLQNYGKRLFQSGLRILRQEQFINRYSSTALLWPKFNGVLVILKEP